MIRMTRFLIPLLTLLSLAPLHAQTATESAKAEGKAFGRGKAAQAQDAATREPDANTVPNFVGIPSQSDYFEDPDSLLPDAGAQAVAHEGYQAMRSSSNQRARFAPVDLEAAIARAQQISADPLNYTSGMNITGAQGRCVPLPAGNASAGRYMATCNSGYFAIEETRSCTVPLAVSVTNQTNYIYWCNESPFNSENGTDDCALYAGPQCRQTAVRPGRCLQWSENGGRPYCVEPGEPISVITCTEAIAGGLLRTTTQTSAVNAVRDESQCAALAADSRCTPAAEICTDNDPVTRLVGGIPVTQPCWAWVRPYQCRSVTTVQDCTELEATPGCNLVREDCLTEEPCQTWERIFDCPLPPTPSADNQYICDGDVYCIDGSCETIEREANDEFKDAVVALNGMDQARREFDPDSLSLFKGERGTCSSKVFGVLNCCKGKGFPLIPGISLLVALGCNAQELLLHERDAQGLCAYVGSYCSDSVLGVCLTKKKVYCCFESKLSRILQEQGRQQLNKPWGKAKTESCAGFTIDEFARLDLSQMDFAEVYAEFTQAARLPDELQAAQDIQQKIEDYYATHGN